MSRSRRVVRTVAALVVLASISALASGYVASNSEAAAGSPPAADTGVADRDGVTVIATDSNAWLQDEGEGPRANAELIGYAPNGSLLYYNDSHDRYWDVDPSPLGERTVTYAASIHLSGAECGAETVCTRNVIERVNLTTGAVTRLYARETPRKHATRWHDVDRLNGSRFLIADIYRDSVTVVDVETGLVEWEWRALSAFDPEGGGPFPRDWTHLNDVEAVGDGRYMASVRNHDQVVFLDRERGLVENWTLGSDGDLDTLHMQHNPDYIPAERGGPAVVVADSENNRLVEYRRTGGEWRRAWQWRDARLQWPRDADRLPNGNTLVTDSNGNRVLEVAPNGTVVWQVAVGFPYEAERLSTGDESAGGPAADRAGLDSRSARGSGDGSATDSIVGRLWLGIKGHVPGPLLNAVVYVVPGWIGPMESVALVAFCTSTLAWLALEWRWSPYTLRWSRPFEVRRK
jgi:hypothetical protein